MDIQPEFKTRDFAAVLAFPNVEMAVERYGFAAIGGPDQATLTAKGQVDALWELVNWLRAPVELIDAEGTARWWGYVHEVVVQVGAIQIGVSLDTLFNRVNVVYSYVAPGSATVGTRANTGWAQDDDSVSEYGTRELLHSLSGDTPASALQARDTVLATMRLPRPVLTPSYGQGEQRATLTLRGWKHTLDWTYFSRAALVEGNTDKTVAEQEFGATLNYPEYAQSFQMAASWRVYNIELNLRVEGSPADSVQIELCSDNSGAPGTVIETVTVAAANIGDTFSYISFVLAAPRLLSASTTYWLVISRTGALDMTNYYVFGVDESLGYASGVLRNHYYMTSWIARVPDADALFRVNGVEETTAQITQIESDEGQFLAGTIIEDTSGVYTSPYRDGDSTALAEVAALLKRGTTNDRRLLAEVTRDRYLRVYEEPELDDETVGLLIDSDGALSTPLAGALDAGKSPVGQWCQFKDMPATVNMGLLADASFFFIETAEFDVETQTWQVTPRGAPTPWELSTIGDG